MEKETHICMGRENRKERENNSLKVRENRIDGEGNPHLHGEG